MSRLTFEVSHYSDGSFSISVIVNNVRIGYIKRIENTLGSGQTEYRFHSDNTRPQAIVNAYKKKYVPIKVEVLE